jgi:hypothetical protein
MMSKAEEGNCTMAKTLVHWLTRADPGRCCYWPPGIVDGLSSEKVKDIQGLFLIAWLDGLGLYHCHILPWPA